MDIDAVIQSRVHQRQYVIGPRPHRVRTDWDAVALGGDRYLSLGPRGRIVRGDGGWLIGTAVEPDASRPPPVEALGGDTSGWVGRWIALAGGQLHLDASAMLPAFYRTIDEGDRRGLWISSSVAILDALAPHAEHEIDRRAWDLERSGLFWFTPPRTRFARIRRLLPSQVIDYTTGAITARPLLPPAETDDWEEAARLLALLTKSAVAALAARAERVWVASTAGGDSRVVLAAAHAARVDFSCYTQWDEVSSPEDFSLPPELARLAGVEHRLIRGAAPYSQRAEALALIAEHAGGHDAVSDDRNYLARGQFEIGGEADLILRGGGFEIGRCRAWAKLPAAPDGIAPLDAILSWFGEAHDTGVREGLGEWRAWVVETPNPGLDWRDRMTWEQMYGGWFADVEQVIDLAPLISINPINSARLYRLLLTAPPSLRATLEHQRQVVRLLCPQIAEQPFFS